MKLQLGVKSEGSQGSVTFSRIGRRLPAAYSMYGGPVAATSNVYGLSVN